METRRFTDSGVAWLFLVDAGFSEERAYELLELAVANGRYGTGAIDEQPHLSMSYNGGQWAIKVGPKP